MSVWIPSGYKPHDQLRMRCTGCGTRCSKDVPCDCCELAELRSQVETLNAERLEVRRLAIELAFQPTDHDDDTEAEIRAGRSILRAMGETLPPHWSDGSNQ